MTDSDVLPLGRDRELGELATLLDRACSGAGGALVIGGEAGAGKTALLEHGRRLAGVRGMRVLTGSGVQAEAGLPFAALHQLLRPVLGSLPKISPPQARLLRAALRSEEHDLYRVALAALELLATAAAEIPILLTADDAHWMDRPSTDVLAFVSRRVASEPLAVVIGVRDGTGDPFTAGGLAKVTLEPLGPGPSATLLDRVAPGLTDELRRLVLRDAAGNPLALTQLPLTAPDWGLSPHRRPVGELIERSFAARAADLPEPTRALLLLAAAGTGSVLGELCAAAAETYAEQAGAADLQPAIDARLVSLVDERVVFRHPVLASAIYQSADLGQRLRTHTALANVVADDDRRAWHRAAAALGPDDALARDLEALAERSAQRGAVGVSIAALDRAAALTADHTRAADTLVRASAQAAETGRHALALDLAGRADRSRLSALGRARLMTVEDGLDRRAAAADLTLPGLIGAAGAAKQAGDLDLAAAVLWTTAQRCYRANGPAADRAAIDAATRALELPADDSRRTVILAWAGHAHERGALERAGGEAADRGSAAMTLGNHREAARLLAGAMSAARRSGRRGDLPRLGALRAWATLWSGTMAEATAAAGETEQLAAESAQPRWRDAAVLARALATGLRGDYHRAKEQVRQASADADVRVFRALAVTGLGVVALGAGEYQEAYGHLRRVVDPADPASHYAARQWVAGDLVEAAARAGRLGECAGLLDDLGREWRLDPTSTTRFKIAYGEALLADGNEARERFEALLEADATDLDRGRLQLAYGSWLRRRRHGREARGALGAARELFNRLGLRGFAQQADRELRAAGGTDRRRRGSGPAGLTPQELQIARLAADGLSNRQIAEQLFLSHRTVSSHLYHVFPKLDVTARAELSRALDGGAP